MSKAKYEIECVCCGRTIEWEALEEEYRAYLKGKKDIVCLGCLSGEDRQCYERSESCVNYSYGLCGLSISIKLGNWDGSFLVLSGMIG